MKVLSLPGVVAPISDSSMPAAAIGQEKVGPGVRGSAGRGAAGDGVGAVAEGRDGGAAAAAQRDGTAGSRNRIAVLVQQLEVAPDEDRTVGVGADLGRAVVLRRHEPVVPTCTRLTTDSRPGYRFVVRCH